MPSPVQASAVPGPNLNTPVIDLEVAAQMASQPVIPGLVAPLMATARAELDDVIQRNRWSFSPSFLADLVAWYGQGIARLTNSLILQRFTSYRLILDPLWRPAPAVPGDAPQACSRSALDAYVAWEDGERLFAIDGPYPELGRVLQEWRGNWLSASQELFRRLIRHRSEIADLVGVGRPRDEPIIGARFGISDPHCGGRSAAILEFENHKIVYKPRSVDGEAAWAELATRVLGEALGLSGYPLRVLQGRGYGFMEFVDHSPCEDLTGVQRCFRRYGGLLALAHGLGTIDLHHENVIVCGEQPVVVDAEPLFRGRLALSAQGEQRLDFEQNLSLQGIEARESVLELGMLPINFQPPLPSEDNPQRIEIEVGAFTAYGREPLPDFLPCARGSDGMHMRQVAVTTNRYPNLPRIGATTHLATDHVDEIIAGFESVHGWLVANRGSLSAEGGPLQSLGGRSIRLLVRPTMAYFNVLSRSLGAGPLSSSEGRREQLASDLDVIGVHRFDSVGELVQQEVESLLAGDIPRFELAAGDDSCTGVPLHCPPLESALERLASLDGTDRRIQVGSIRERLRNRGREVALAVPRGTDQASLERHALLIVESLVAAACDHESAPRWIYAAHAPGFGSTMAHADSESLYEGASGTAVAIAEAGRVAGRRDWCDLAVRVFSPLATYHPTSIHRGGGLGRGLGGLLYSMLRVSEAAGNGALLDTAFRLALDHGRRVGAADGIDEVLNGRAGLLLAILALNERRPDERLREIADVLVNILLDRADVGNNGFSWRAEGTVPMANVSHGAAGIGMALARYARVREDQRAAEAALAAIRFDETAWIEEEAGWRDGRLDPDRDGPRTTWSWCNGRSGGMLARRAVEQALGQPESMTSHKASQAPLGDVLQDGAPGLCCGTPGVVDCLLHLGSESRHGVPHLADGVRLLAEKDAPSHYSTLTGSLFTGTSGLAFALLRAAHPDTVPSLLWFG